VKAFTYFWRGDQVAVFQLGNHTLCHTGGNWHFADTHTGASIPWGVDYVIEHAGDYFCAQGERFGKLDRVNLDFGDTREALIEMGFQHPEQDRFTASRLRLGISQGFNSAVSSVGLSTTEDGVLYGPTLFRSTGAQGRYSDRLVWEPSGGLGYYRGYMGIRLSTTGDINFSSDGLVIDT